MSDYLANEIKASLVEFSREQERIPWTEKGDHHRGMQAGFEIALRAYGVFHDGKQTIGCMATPIKDAAKEFADALNKVS